MSPAAEQPRLRSLNRPRPARVETAAGGQPAALHISGRRLAVEAVLERWRIDDEWWRPKPISRMYYRLALEDGRLVDVYRALKSGRPSTSVSTGWYRQTY